MTRWKRIDKRGAPDWLYELIGATGSSWWVRYRREGLKIEEKIEGRIDSWIDARRLGQALIDEIRGARVKNKEAPSLVRSEEICNELVHLAKAKAPATYEQREIFMRVHLIPWLNVNCPYGADFDSTVWEKYKTDKRLENPSVALFNHWKFFVMFSKHAFEQGILKKRYKLEFDEKREDFRERGMVIPDEHLKLLLWSANSFWSDRIMIQRFTGMRPGEVRNLRIDRVDLATGVIRLEAEETKTRSARSFKVTSPTVLAILKARAQKAQGSVYFFPSRGNPNQPLGRCLAGWENALAAANRALAKAGRPPMPAYTPHDLRHTFLSQMFKTASNPALICYYAGLSIEEAQKTYLHFTAEDTHGIADAACLTASLGKNLGSEVMQAEEILEK